ncbi:Re/Si-specific NAD(P)(+) transhydrogenase subunit alpha [Janibacter sp. GS2]|uniref:Re/Si-specific NAD(P)(+) transhydrogenase subunit alpha n=1 Tax=Janibacter sp. GS2 TaxID=3442646 RepID=UPI003EBE43E3
MRLGVPKESKAGETRVAATPKTVEALIKLGYDVSVEPGAGAASAYPDQGYVDAGATVGAPEEVWASDIVAKVNAPTAEEVPRLRSGAILASLLSPALNPDTLETLRAQGVTAMAMDAVPRISRAQSLDVLSSMANIAGYRAVVESAHEFGGLFTGQVTAAGKVPPAKVLVCGAGVAGLAAIGAAGSLGAIVRAFDVRPEVAEQVESMGADFLEVDLGDGAQEGQSSDGYAKEASEDFNAKAAELYAEQAKDVDIIITTALIPGREAPRLITEEMVASMKPGSVIIDMAAGSGGNVAGSVADERVVTDNGVRIIGYTDLAGRLPTQASQLYGTNIVNLLKLLTPAKDGVAVLDLEDTVVRGMTVTKGEETLWPPPPVQVSAAPAAPAAAEPAPEKEVKPVDPNRKFWLIGGAAALFLIAAAFMPAAFLSHFIVFALAVVIGFYVIGNVHHALHTPLMSVTNAISGIIVVGALLQVTSSNLAIQIIAAAAVFFASINVFGGFTVTSRMLNMFRKG